MRGNDSNKNKESQQEMESYFVPLTTNSFYACLVACLGTMAAGCVVAYSSPAMPNINSQPNPFHLTQKQQVWFGNVFALGAIFGFLASFFIMDAFGRKIGVMVAVLPSVAGWTVIAASPNVAIFYLGRLITGFSKGLFSGITRVYIAEIAPPDMRGMLITIASVSNVVGNLYEYCLGYAITWNWLAIASAAIPAVLICLMCFLPESPRYLMLRGKTEEAEEALTWLRDNHEGITNEMMEIERSIIESGNAINWKALIQFSFLKPLLICLGIFTMQQCSGNIVFRMYTVSIFDGAATTRNSYGGTIVVGLVGVAGTLSSTVLIDHIGRKKLLIASCLSMAVFMSAIGAYFWVYECHEQYAVTYMYWVPVISLILNNFCYSLAYDSIPWIITSELFPTRTRAAAISIAGMWQNICCFAVSSLFFCASSVIDYYWKFWVFAIICIIGGIVIGIFLPETKRKPLEISAHKQAYT